ncbi:MAG TPA: septal ring lytic transglycosylase RlpA family protein [Stellaceae bacterium]|nr:septal ring lytic transglycosylase RlpA family protein [Stellaceae bacterium]
MRRLVLTLSLSGLAILLAACAARPPYGGAPAAVPHPVYKVGKPYQIDGVWYYPAEDLTYDKTGIASWYGEDFNGKYTANGEVFNINGLTAAHRTLPMPSIVQVTNLENGRSLELRIDDRGPYARGRIIDVSRRAAQLLGFEASGTAKVRVRILAPESIQAKLLAERASGQAVAESAPAMPLAPVIAAKLPIPAGVHDAKDDLPPPARRAPQPVPEPPRNYTPLLSERVMSVAVRPTNIYIQAGAFARRENANRLKAKLAKLGPVHVSNTEVNGTYLFRVRIGPVRSVGDADRLLGLVVGDGAPDAQIIVD